MIISRLDRKDYMKAVGYELGLRKNKQVWDRWKSIAGG
jgi:hypothetical protein